MQQKSDKHDSEVETVVKILGSLSAIQSIRECLQKEFEIIKSSPCYENLGSPGYHTFLNIKT